MFLSNLKKSFNDTKTRILSESIIVSSLELLNSLNRRVFFFFFLFLQSRIHRCFYKINFDPYEAYILILLSSCRFNYNYLHVTRVLLLLLTGNYSFCNYQRLDVFTKLFSASLERIHLFFTFIVSFQSRLFVHDTRQNHFALISNITCEINFIKLFLPYIRCIISSKITLTRFDLQPANATLTHF